MSVEERLVELETRLAFQDDVVASLSDELALQQRTIERLQLQIAELARRQIEMAGQFGIAEDEAPPPHY